ncbi:unnamed protein product [Oikopleura dioica]|uniref:CUB domain-containing protein n=1 Tax=Oikopleura dioica TaxID=34765 RepID=E4X264_OIKDI|nr:unnamed protein product [Oikopleura dioica]
MSLGRSGQPDERDFMGDIMKNDFLLEPLSKPKRCGKVEINEDSTAGKISTKNPYTMNTRCTWKIDSSCSALKWRFTSFSIEDDTDTYENDYYYEQYYDNHEASDNVKWWMCSFDHVQVFYGTGIITNPLVWFFTRMGMRRGIGRSMHEPAIERGNSSCD